MYVTYSLKTHQEGAEVKMSPFQIFIQFREKKNSAVARWELLVLTSVLEPFDWPLYVGLTYSNIF